MTDVATIHHLPSVQSAPSSAGLLANADRFEFGWRAASLFAASQLVPQHLRGKKEDCFIAIHMAERLNEDPLIVMQNIYIVSGRAGWSAQYMIGRANRSGIFKGRINWRQEGKGDTLSVTAYATLADTGEVVDANASMAMAKAEGWTKNAKYQSMPDLMLRYRSATMLVRLYASDVMFGIPSAEELQDMRSAGTLRPSANGGYETVDGGEIVTAEADPFEQAAAGTKQIEQNTAAEPKPQETKAEDPRPQPEPQGNHATDDAGDWALLDASAWLDHVYALSDMIDASTSPKALSVMQAAPKFAEPYAAMAKHAPASKEAVDKMIADRRKALS